MYRCEGMNSSRRSSQLADEPRRPSPGRFEDAIEQYRRELLVSCYQMLGSAHDAEDVVQETMLRAWRSRDAYDPDRASIRTWLHTIATNASLTALKSRQRRPLPSTLVEPGDDAEQPLTPTFDVPWLQPIATNRLDLGAHDPVVEVLRRGQVRLAFCAALQRLPARQRAALVLCEVLDFTAAEAAEILATTVPATNSLLQRARRVTGGLLADDSAAITSADDEELVERYTNAFTRADVPGLTALFANDAILEMPPVPLWYRGAELYGKFMSRVYRLRGHRWKTVRTSANGQPAFAAYALTDDAYQLHTLQVLSIANGLITRNVVFQHPDALAELQLPHET